VMFTVFLVTPPKSFSVCLLARELPAVSDPHSQAPCLWLAASVCAVCQCPQDRLSIAGVCRTAVAIELTEGKRSLS